MSELRGLEPLTPTLPAGWLGFMHPLFDGALASNFHAKATTATIRVQLIAVAARVTRSARRATLRLPTTWPWATAWQHLFTATTGPPPRR